ncbi:MAG: 3-isopropylmalate dehydratase [Candidatus Lokiarchaeota archaeon]|nr:3-isopropylmalate dehydratase [Candidatus Lokiarchaeota archaeon]MBD3340721.1 3-isopropylmalate dehydratase [Candidatus Lokiarchaeota archaeon]
MKNIKGLVYLMGDNINTDDIVPSHTLTMRNCEDMAQCACETIDSNFAKVSKTKNIIVAGENFGCGSSREEAVTVFQILGIKAIIAKSFSRIYFRNLINLGIPGITMNWNSESFSDGDEIEISINDGFIKNKSKNEIIFFQKLPDFLTEILEEGGILNKLKKTLKT